jgi:hypothetical protein
MNWDELFQKEFIESEKDIPEDSGAYKNLKYEALYTSSADFFSIFSFLGPVKTFVDLGAGMGQGCLIYSHLFPTSHSIAVDFVEGRLGAGKKIARALDIQNITFLQQDLFSNEIPDGDVYFLYFPTGMVLDRILSELYRKEKNFKLVAIESHGDLYDRLAKENWLKPLHELTLISSRHSPLIKIFERTFDEKSPELIPHEISFQKKVLTIKDDDGSIWLGESYGLSWLKDDLYSLECPPRSIRWSQVLKVQDESELSLVQQEARKFREKVTSVRKIFVSPRFSLEISSGEQVEWEKRHFLFGAPLC